MITIIDKHLPREYSLIIHNNGVTLCDSQEGALFCMRYAEDVERLCQLLATIEIKRLPSSAGDYQK